MLKEKEGEGKSDGGNKHGCQITVQSLLSMTAAVPRSADIEHPSRVVPSPPRLVGMRRLIGVSLFLRRVRRRGSRTLITITTPTYLSNFPLSDPVAPSFCSPLDNIHSLVLESLLLLMP